MVTAKDAAGERRREAAALTQRGIELYFRGHYEKALVLIEQALALEATFVRAYTAKAHCLAELGKAAEGLAAAAQALALAPTSAIGYSARAVCKHRLRDDAGAEADYRKSLELAPDDFRVYYNFACYWAEHGDEEQCRTYLRHALELGPASFADIAGDDPDLARYNRTEWFRELVAEIKRKAAGL